MTQVDDIVNRVLSEHGLNHLVRFAAIGIDTPEKLRTHLSSCLDDPQLRCMQFHLDTARDDRAADLYLHDHSGTVIVVPKDASLDATAFRPPSIADWVEQKCRDTQHPPTRDLVAPNFVKGFDNYQQWKAANGHQQSGEIAEQPKVKLYDPDEARQRRIEALFSPSQSTRSNDRDRDDEHER